VTARFLSCQWKKSSASAPEKKGRMQSNKD
jgi:hypothetical protein